MIKWLHHIKILLKRHSYKTKCEQEKVCIFFNSYYTLESQGVDINEKSRIKKC